MTREVLVCDNTGPRPVSVTNFADALWQEVDEYDAALFEQKLVVALLPGDYAVRIHQGFRSCSVNQTAELGGVAS